MKTAAFALAGLLALTPFVSDNTSQSLGPKASQVEVTNFPPTSLSLSFRILQRDLAEPISLPPGFAHVAISAISMDETRARLGNVCPAFGDSSAPTVTDGAGSVAAARWQTAPLFINPFGGVISCGQDRDTHTWPIAGDRLYLGSSPYNTQDPNIPAPSDAEYFVHLYLTR